MSPRRPIPLIRILLALGGAAWGAQAGNDLPVLPLDSVLARVEARNPELAMWRFKAQGRTAAAAGARAWMPPELGAGGTELPYGGMASDMAPGDPALMLSARQMIPGPGKRAARQRYLESLAAVDRADGAWMRAQLRSDAKGRYAALAQSTRRLGVLREAEAVMALMLDLAESRFKLRRGDMAAVFAARARLAELRIMRTEEESMRAQARSALAFLMASPDSDAFEADTNLALRGYAGAAGEGLGMRADVARAGLALESMRLNLDAMGKAGRPDFGIQFEHMEMFGMGRRFSVMAMATLPRAPWSGGMVNADVKAMKHEIDAMRAERDSKSLMARRMAEETRLMLAAEAANFAGLRDSAAPAYRQAMDAASAAFQEGIGDLFRVLDAWDRWTMSRMQALTHLEKALILEAVYERETGRP